ncbi:MAG: hypothetical protein Q9195_007281 [Heterodermia aff. obscurata]
MPSFLSNLDESTRNRLIKTNAAQGINDTQPDQQYGSQPPVVDDSAPRYFPSYEASQVLEKIYSAIETADLEIVKTLVKDKDYHPTTKYLPQALAKAVDSQQVSIVQYLLSEGAGIDRAVLAAAAQAKSLPIFEIMVQAGWDVNAPMFGGHTMLASLTRSPSLVTWFLHHGADPNLGPPRIGCNSEATPIPNSGVCLYEAAASSTTEVVELLIQAGAKVENSTPLHAAVRRGQDAIPMLRYLLNLPLGHGIDINGLPDQCDPFSVGTPLESVIRHGVRSDSVAIARFLLDNGADPHPDGRPGIDVFDDPVRSQLEEVHEQWRLRQEEE